MQAKRWDRPTKKTLKGLGNKQRDEEFEIADASSIFKADVEQHFSLLISRYRWNGGQLNMGNIQYQTWEAIWHIITHKSSNRKASARPSNPERGTWSPTSPKQSECCRHNKIHWGVQQQGILEVSKHTGAQIHHSLMASHTVLAALYQEPQRSRVHLTTQRRMGFTSCSELYYSHSSCYNLWMWSSVKIKTENKCCTTTFSPQSLFNIIVNMAWSALLMWTFYHGIISPLNNKACLYHISFLSFSIWQLFHPSPNCHILSTAQGGSLS